MKRYGAVHFYLPDSQPPAAGAQPVAVAIANSFSPWVELDEDDLLFLDLQGMGRRWREEQKLALAIKTNFEEHRLHAQVAVASNRVTARLAARSCADIAVVPPGQEAAFLSPLPLQLLKPSEDLQMIFDRWGLRTLGDLARLPQNSLSRRLGKAGMELYFQARGRDNTPLSPRIPIEPFQTAFKFDWPLENRESLGFTLHPLLERLCAQLAAASLSAEAVELCLDLANRASHRRLLRFGMPLRHATTILSLLRLDLEGRPPEAAISALMVRLHPIPPRPVQFSLIDPPLPSPELLTRTLARLAALVGENNVGSPALLDSHGPDAFVMQPFQPAPAVRSRRAPAAGRKLQPGVLSRRYVDNCCRRDTGTGRLQPEMTLSLCLFRPALAARVTTQGGRPATVATGAIYGRVAECGGPWRGTGGWWDPQQRWTRDEWEVLLSDGGVYRLYRDLRDEEWFVDGIYD